MSPEYMPDRYRIYELKLRPKKQTAP